MTELKKGETIIIDAYDHLKALTKVYEQFEALQGVPGVWVPYDNALNDLYNFIHQARFALENETHDILIQVTQASVDKFLVDETL